MALSTCVVHLLALLAPALSQRALSSCDHVNPPADELGSYEADNLLTGTAADVSLDNVMGGTSTATVSVSLDSVMGGTSTATVAEGSSVLFEGYCNLTSGGFANLNFDLSASTLNLRNYFGFTIEVTANSPSLNRGAPLSATFEFGSGAACNLMSSFPIPISEPTSDGEMPTVTLFMSKEDLRPNGPFWTYGWPADGADGFYSGTCLGDYADETKIDRLTVTFIYEEGPFSLNIHSILGLKQPPSLLSLFGAGPSPPTRCESCTLPLPNAELGVSFGTAYSSTVISTAEGAADYLDRALDRGRSVESKGQPVSYAGVGTMQMTSLAMSIYEQSARQLAATEGLPCDVRQSLLAAANEGADSRVTRFGSVSPKSPEPKQLPEKLAVLEQALVDAAAALRA